MKKILFTSFVLFLTSVGHSQKKLRDKNSKILYSYILDSLVKMGENEFLKKPFTVARETSFLNTLQYKLLGVKNYIEIYQGLNKEFKVDSIELSKLKVNSRILTNKNIDTSNYTLVNNDYKFPHVIFSEPIYFGNKKFCIIHSYVYSFLSTSHVFFKKNNRWVYYNEFCVTME